MKVSVEMTDEEFAEFLEFRKAKEIAGSEIQHLQLKIGRLANLVLRAVGYDIEADDNYEVEDIEAFVSAVDFAVECVN